MDIHLSNQKRRHPDRRGRLIRKYYPEILRYCYLHIPDRGYAEDMTQETFVRFFDSLKGYAHQGKTKNNLYTIAANLCWNYHSPILAVFLDNAAKRLNGSIGILETVGGGATFYITLPIKKRKKVNLVKLGS